MLKLTRKVDESIIIKLPNQERIFIKPTSIESNQVKIGIQAHRDISIFREELLKIEDDTPLLFL